MSAFHDVHSGDRGSHLLSPDKIFISRRRLTGEVIELTEMTPAPAPPAPVSSGSNPKFCQKCGAPNDPNAAYCVQCGNGYFGAAPVSSIERPLGVTVLAILQILGSLGTIAAGFAIGAVLPLLGAAFGVALIVIGVITLLIAIALFSGRNWARILNIIFAVIDLINFPIGTILGIVFLIYFTRPHVVAYFKQPR